MTTLREAAQQALEALQWHYRQGHSNTLGGFRLKIDEKALRELSAALAQQGEPVQEQDVEDAIEAAYWHFDARKKGLNEWACAPQSERGAFKAEARKLVRGYFLTRQAQDTKREMLAVADAFIRGKRSAQEQAEPDHETRAELAEQQVVQLAEERDHYRNLWQKAQQGEPVEPAYKVEIAGRWHDTEPLAPAFSLPDGEHLLYTAPSQRKPLTDEEVRKHLATAKSHEQTWLMFARAIERAHGIKE